MRKQLSARMKRLTTGNVKRDIVAALVVTAIAIPQSLAFAGIAGLPPVVGLYTALLAPIVFVIFANTKRLVLGADSAIAAIVASGAVLVAQVGTVAYSNSVAVITLLTALFLLIFSLFRLGFIANLVSRPVLVGFLAGVGIQLVVTRLPSMLGITSQGEIWQQLTQFGEINWMTFTISVLVVGLILIMRRTSVPGELVGIIAATLFAMLFSVEQYGVALVGALPSGLPTFVWPTFSINEIIALIPTALSIAIIVLVQSATVIRNLASEHGEKVQISRDLLALGLANAGAALTQAFPVNGSPLRSLVADMAGGRPRVVNVLVSLMIGVILLFGSVLFTHMPEAALASVIFVLGFRLIRVNELKETWNVHRSEFVVVMIALVGTALLGVRHGVVIAIVASLVERLIRQYRPKDYILLRDGELSPWAVDRFGEKIEADSRQAGVLVYSFDGPLFFENINFFMSRLDRAITGAREPVRYVIIDAGAMDSVDYTAVSELKSLYYRLSADEVELSFAHVSPDLADQFKLYGVTNLIGEDHIFSTLGAAVVVHSRSDEVATEKVKKLKLSEGRYVVVGGAVLEVLGLRSANDVDIVVHDSVYAEYRDGKNWKEYILDNGRKVLSRNGCNLMRMSRSYTLKQLIPDSVVVDGVRCMSVKKLIDSKLRTARPHDIADVKLLEDYLAARRQANAKKR